MVLVVTGRISSFEHVVTGFRGYCPNTEVRNFPLLSEEGWTRPRQNFAKPPLWSGRCGDQFHRLLWSLNRNPSVRTKDASRRFLVRSATPPRREGGTPPHHHLGNRSFARDWITVLQLNRYRPKSMRNSRYSCRERIRYSVSNKKVMRSGIIGPA